MSRIATKLKVVVPVVFVLGALAYIGGSYLFREETVENERLGRFTFIWRWGKASTFLLDKDRDGVVDFKARFDPPREGFFTHDLPDEYWEDRDGDSFFEVHVTLKQGEIESVELDRDADGVVDETLVGPEAEAFYMRNSPPPVRGP